MLVEDAQRPRRLVGEEQCADQRDQRLGALGVEREAAPQFWLTTGSYTVAGNVTSTASTDQWWWPHQAYPCAGVGIAIRGTMRASAQGTMRLLAGAWSKQYAATFGQQELAGSFNDPAYGLGTLAYRRSALDLRLAFASGLGLQGLASFAPSYRPLLATAAQELQLTSFLP